jgi:hypothetical protein
MMPSEMSPAIAHPTQRAAYPPARNASSSPAKDVAYAVSQQYLTPQQYPELKQYPAFRQYREYALRSPVQLRSVQFSTYPQLYLQPYPQSRQLQYLPNVLYLSNAHLQTAQHQGYVLPRQVAQSRVVQYRALPPQQAQRPLSPQYAYSQYSGGAARYLGGVAQYLSGVMQYSGGVSDRTLGQYSISYPHQVISHHTQAPITG